MELESCRSFTVIAAVSSHTSVKLRRLHRLLVSGLKFMPFLWSSTDVGMHFLRQRPECALNFVLGVRSHVAVQPEGLPPRSPAALFRESFETEESTVEHVTHVPAIDAAHRFDGLGDRPDVTGDSVPPITGQDAPVSVVLEVDRNALVIRLALARPRVSILPKVEVRTDDDSVWVSLVLQPVDLMLN